MRLQGTGSYDNLKRNTVGPGTVKIETILMRASDERSEWIKGGD